MHDQIQILSPDQIAVERWNDCVLGSPSGSVFGMHQYLSHMTDHWCGLVIGDYAAVLPLIYKTKWGIRYLYGIPFVKQLGIMGGIDIVNGVDRALLLKAIHSFCRYGDIAFNQYNDHLIALVAVPKTNYSLDLNTDYQTLWNSYRKSLRRRLRKNEKAGINDFQLLEAGIEEVLDAYAHFIQTKFKTNLTKDFKRLRVFLQTDIGRHHYFPYKLMDGSGVIQVLGIYVKDGFKVYNYMSVQVHMGREKNAMAVAVDMIIQKYCGQPFVFDFMGSSIPGVREFIHGFGAREGLYHLYHFNHLPWPLNKLKR